MHGDRVRTILPKHALRVPKMRTTVTDKTMAVSGSSKRSRKIGSAWENGVCPFERICRVYLCTERVANEQRDKEQVRPCNQGLDFLCILLLSCRAGSLDDLVEECG